MRIIPAWDRAGEIEPDQGINHLVFKISAITPPAHGLDISFKWLESYFTPDGILDTQKT